MDLTGAVLLQAVGALLLLAVVLLAVLLVTERRRRRRDLADLADLRAEVEGLQARLDPPLVAAEPVHRTDEPDEPAEFVITRIGTAEAEPSVPDRLVLSVAFGEPLVRTLALAHGVRRALSAESRNRIRFEVRREVRRSRKERRRKMREAWRATKRDQRGAGRHVGGQPQEDVA